MDGQGGELLDAKPLQDRGQGPLPAGQIAARQELAGDQPAPRWGSALLVELAEGRCETAFGGAIGGGRFQVVDACGKGCAQHGLHLGWAVDSPHGAQGEGRHRWPAAKGSPGPGARWAHRVSCRQDWLRPGQGRHRPRAWPC